MPRMLALTERSNGNILSDMEITREMTKKYGDKWVAFAPDEKTIVGSGETLNEAMDEAAQKGFKNPLVFNVPIGVLPYVGSPQLEVPLR